MIKLTHQAKDDIRGIKSYYRSQSKTRDKIIDAIKAGFKHIEANPDACAVDLDVPDVRFHPVGSYNIFYLKDTKPPQVTRVLHHAQDRTFIGGR